MVIYEIAYGGRPENDPAGKGGAIAMVRVGATVAHDHFAIRKVYIEIGTSGTYKHAFKVDHIPTGWSVCPDAQKSMENATAFCDSLQTAPVDWGTFGTREASDAPRLLSQFVISAKICARHGEVVDYETWLRGCRKDGEG